MEVNDELFIIGWLSDRRASFPLVFFRILIRPALTSFVLDERAVLLVIIVVSSPYSRRKYTLCSPFPALSSIFLACISAGFC